MGKIVLMRHGTVDHCWRDTFLGATDVGLSGEGRALVARIAQRIPLDAFSQILCSDLLRSRQTAESIADVLGIGFVVERRFREIDMGKWDGKRRSEVKRAYPAEYRRRGHNLWHYRCSGSRESFALVASRADYVIRDYIKNSENYLIITHAGVMRSLICLYEGKAFADVMRHPCGYGEMLLLTQDGSGAVHCEKFIDGGFIHGF
jgi:probable phosphoglycerate mutase